MTPIAPPVPDKSHHLARFISEHVTDGAEVTVIARSVDSPIAAALASVREVLESKHASTRVIFLQTPSALWQAEPSTAHSGDIRVALNPRLLEAHEQLVIGTSAVWIGDCMRRDPAKRDAFSQEKVACPVTSRFAAISFDRLWAIATPMLGSVAGLSSITDVTQRRESAG